MKRRTDAERFAALRLGKLKHRAVSLEAELDESRRELAGLWRQHRRRDHPEAAEVERKCWNLSRNLDTALAELRTHLQETRQ